MSGLYLSFLGHFVVSLQDRPLNKFRTKRVQALLAYLVAESSSGDIRHQREKLMELLWPGLPLKSARANLRQTLYYLRQAIGEWPGSDNEDPVPFILTDRSTAGINPAFPQDSDISVLARLLSGPITGWTQANDLYRGDFLADFYLPDANTFEEWASSRRAAYRRQILDALDTLTTERLAQGDYAASESFALRQLELDNLRESAYRQLMQLYAWSGRQAEALNLFQTCVTVLQEDLGSPPDETTARLYEAIRANQLPPPPVKPEILVQPAQEKATALPANPYKGLLSFREEDAPYFFGRELFTSRLMTAVERNPFVAIIGPSGSGKSSVLHAGLMARLRQEKSWTIAEFRPGNDPYQSLTAALLPFLEPEMTETDRLVETRKLSLALKEASLTLNDVVDRILVKHTEVNSLLLVADHFEELYTLDSDVASRRDLLDSFLDIIAKQPFKPQHSFCLVLAVRADFLDQVLSYRPFADAFQDANLILGAMNYEELSRAIEKPAEIQGVSFEPGLVERILADVGDEPGHLPLLEFALTALWERQDSGQLTHADYEVTGRVEGALTRYADQVYESLVAADRAKAQYIFVQLVRPGQHTADSKRLSRRAELGEGTWTLAQRLAESRLVVLDRDASGQETIELAHETLIRCWERLRSWLEADRAFRIWQERLRAAVHQWRNSGQDEGALLRGAPLNEAESWLVKRNDQLSADEIAFIEVSLALRQRQLMEKEQNRLARERTRRSITIGLAVGLMLAIALLTLAAIQWNNARHAQELAEAERDQTQNTLAQLLASQAELLATDQLDLAQLLAVEAFRKHDSPQTRGSLLTVVSHLPQIRKFLHGHAGQVRAVAISPNGKILASAGDENIIQLWDLPTGQPLGPPLVGHEEQVWSLAFSPDGNILASGSFDDTIILWDVASGQSAFYPFMEQADNIWSLAFSPDGELLASGSADGTIHLWRAEDGRQIGAPIPAHGGTVAALAFSPDGRILASGGRDGTAVLWQLPEVVNTGTFPADEPAIRQLGAPLAGHNSTVRAIDFSPDGQQLATGGYDKTIMLWDIAPANAALDHNPDAIDQETVLAVPLSSPISGHEDRLTSLRFGADKSRLVSASADGQVILWDMTHTFDQGSTRDAPAATLLTRHSSAIWSLAISSDGQTMATTGEDGWVIIWNVNEQNSVIVNDTQLREKALAVGLSPDGQTLVTGDFAGNIVFWEEDKVGGASGKMPGQPIKKLTGKPETSRSSWPSTIVYSPDGRKLAVGYSDGTINLWDMSAEEPLATSLKGHTGLIMDIAFTQDSRMMASLGRDGIVQVWDVNAGQALTAPLSGHLGHRGSLTFNRQGDLLATSAGGRIVLRSIIEDLSSSQEKVAISAPEKQLELNFYPTQSPGIAFSPDGKTFALGLTNGMLAILDASSGETVLETSSGHDGEIWGIAFTPDGKIMITVSYGGQVVLWDADRNSLTFGQRLGSPIDGPWLGDEPQISFSEDALKIAATGEGGMVVQWHIDSDSWQAIACQRANRNLTQVEWQQYFGDEPYRLTCPNLPSGEVGK